MSKVSAFLNERQKPPNIRQTSVKMLTILKAAGVLLAAFLFLATEEHRRQKEVKEAWLIFDTVFLNPM
jgi:hypothetical protein